MPKPKAPRWHVAGDIPDLDPRAARPEQLESFDEDMLQMTDPTGRYTVDVGWYPAGSQEGHFVCRLVTRDDWDRPTECMETASTKMLWAWLRQQIGSVASLIGEAGSFATNIGLYLYQSRSKAQKAKRAIGTPRPRIVPAFLRPLAALAGAPLSSFVPGESDTPRTMTSSTGTAIGIGVGDHLALHAA